MNVALLIGCEFSHSVMKHYKLKTKACPDKLGTTIHTEDRLLLCCVTSVFVVGPHLFCGLDSLWEVFMPIDIENRGDIVREANVQMIHPDDMHRVYRPALLSMPLLRFRLGFRFR